MDTETCFYHWYIYFPIHSARLKTKPFSKKNANVKWDMLYKHEEHMKNFILRLKCLIPCKINAKYKAILRSQNHYSQEIVDKIFRGEFEFDNNVRTPSEEILFERTIIQNYERFLCDFCSKTIRLSIDITSTISHQILQEKPSTDIKSSYQNLKGTMYGDHLLSSLMADSEFCDLKIVVKGIEFKAHKNILAAVSPVFRAMLTNDMLEKNSNCLTIHNLEVSTARLMIDFIYKGRIKLSNYQTASDLLKASDIYDIQNLRKFCIDYLLKQINGTSVIEILVIAETTNSLDLKKSAMEYFVNNPKKYNQSDFENILKTSPHIFPALLTSVFEAYTNCKI